MSAVHRRIIDLLPRFIPLIDDLDVELGDLIEFGVKGGTAWVLIPGSAVVPAPASEPARLTHGEPGGEWWRVFTAFAVTVDAPVRVEVVKTARHRSKRDLAYSILCCPGGDGSPYYAQGASPPRIRLPPPKE